MKRVEPLKKFFIAAIGTVTIFSGFSCNNSKKETLVQESNMITMTEFSDEVSLLPWSVSQYLVADSAELVTSFLPGDRTRCDKGEPVKIEYSFGRLDGGGNSRGKVGSFFERRFFFNRTNALFCFPPSVR